MHLYHIVQTSPATLLLVKPHSETLSQEQKDDNDD